MSATASLMTPVYTSFWSYIIFKTTHYLISSKTSSMMLGVTEKPILNPVYSLTDWMTYHRNDIYHGLHPGIY